MNFTYESYKELINLLREHRYSFTNYHNYKQYEKPVILRHDVDSSLDKAVTLAKVE